MERYTKEEIKNMLIHKRITFLNVMEAFIEWKGFTKDDIPELMSGLEDYLDNTLS